MHKKSAHLTALLKHWNTPRRLKKWEDKLFAELADYPHNRWEAVFCWLWVNHEGVTEMIRRWHYTWAGVAEIMEMDGIKGSKGAAPTGNAVRRVWGRVCQEMEEREGRKR